MQIRAGMAGRRAGHRFEDSLAAHVNALPCPVDVPGLPEGHVFTGDPALLLLAYIGRSLSVSSIASVTAQATGELATSEHGRHSLSVDGVAVSRCKSDIVLDIQSGDGRRFLVGVSTKQCNKNTPTNAQLFFTTAQAFCNLLRSHGIAVPEEAVYALRQFCGDEGFRPLDMPDTADRQTDPRRFFWEEILPEGRKAWEEIFSRHQDGISGLLFQKAYLGDPFVPTFLLHKTRAAPGWDSTEVALYSMDEIIALSRAYRGFHTKAYSVRKGAYKDPPGSAPHEAPRFGIIQMQRGGQKQHPTQLQFNLEAGYFYRL